MRQFAVADYDAVGDAFIAVAAVEDVMPDDRAREYHVMVTGLGVCVCDGDDIHEANEVTRGMHGVGPA